jgi:hypothetical protein
VGSVNIFQKKPGFIIAPPSQTGYQIAASSYVPCVRYALYLLREKKIGEPVLVRFSIWLCIKDVKIAFEASKNGGKTLTMFFFYLRIGKLNVRSLLLVRFFFFGVRFSHRHIGYRNVNI